MSRLYIKVNSDMRKTLITARGNKEIKITLMYGTKGKHNDINIRLYRDDNKFFLGFDRLIQNIELD